MRRLTLVAAVFLSLMAVRCSSDDSGSGASHTVDLSDCSGTCQWVKGCCPDLDVQQCIKGCAGMFGQASCQACAAYSDCTGFVQCAYQNCGMPHSACSNIP